MTVPVMPAAGRPEETHEQKVRRLRGPDYPLATAGESDKVTYLRRLSESTDPESQARHRQATRNLLYAYGRQYLTFSRRHRAWEDRPLLDEKDVRVTMNYIRPVLRSKSQRMLSGPVQYEAHADNNALDARDRAKLGASLIQSRFEHTDMRAKVDQGLELAMTGGVSVLKSFWNPDIGRMTPATMQVPRYTEAQPDPQTGQVATDADGQPAREIAVGPDGLPVVDTVYVDAELQPVERVEDAFHYRPGDTDTAVRTVFNVRINPEATAWDPGSGLRWLLDTDIISVEQAREMFPEFAEQIQPHDEGDQTGLTLERIAAGAATAGMYGASGHAQSGAPRRHTQQSTVIQEYWELPSTCYPQGRLMVRVGQAVVYDDAFPDGIFPYTPLFDEPAPLTPMGRPCVNDMVSPQDLINRQWTAIDAEMRLAGHGRYASWDIPGIPDQLTPEDRTVIKVPLNTKTMHRSLNQLFHRIEPGNVGADRWRIIDSALRALFDIGGFHEVSRGQVPPGVDSGVAIEHLLEEDRGQLAKAMRALQASLLDWGKKQLAIAVRRYGDVERWLPVDRPDLGYMLESVDGTKLPDPDSITIQLEGFKAQSDTAYRAEIKEAADKQWISPREALRLLDLGRGLNPVFESETRHYGRARRINIAIERGEYQIQPVSLPEGPPLPGEPEMLPQVLDKNGLPFVLPDDDDHAIHLLVLDELVLDDTKAPEIRAIAQMLKAERRQVLQAAAMAAPPA